jgi:hypothetical protein
MSNELPILKETLYNSELEAIFQEYINSKMICKTSREEINNHGGLTNFLEAHNLNEGMKDLLSDIAICQWKADDHMYGPWISATFRLIKGKIEEFKLKNSSNRSDFVKQKLGWMPNHDDLLLQVLNKFRNEETIKDIFIRLHPPIDDDKYFTLCRDADLYLHEVWKGNENIIIENKIIRDVIFNWNELFQNENRKQKELEHFASRYLESIIIIEDEIIDIDSRYVKFWMQFTKINPKNKRPYMTENDVHVFINQAFGGKAIEKTFMPDIKVTELRHAAWLFQRNFSYNKMEMTRIMVDNFRRHFAQEPEKFSNEYSNIKDQDPENLGKRIFQEL